MTKKSDGTERLLAKRVTRLNAVQALFQMEVTKHGLDSVIWEFMDCEFGQTIENVQLQKPIKSFFVELLTSALTNQELIDTAIKQNLAENWEFSRIDPTLRSIFRTAMAEYLLHRTPVGAIRNEYVEITHGFYPNSDQVSFVNAVLSKIIQPNEELKPEKPS